MWLCGSTTFFLKNNTIFVLLLKKNSLPLHRYPENNLFTLKKLIPIEDSKRSPAKVIAFLFIPILRDPQPPKTLQII